MMSGLARFEKSGIAALIIVKLIVLDAAGRHSPMERGRTGLAGCAVLATRLLGFQVLY